jgi:membrane-associated phospholipid phosphatase
VNLGRSSVGGLLAAFAGCVLVVVSMLVAVRTSALALSVIDPGVRDLAHDLAAAWPWWPDALWIVTVAGAGNVTAAAGVVVAIWFYWRRQWRPTALLVITALTAESVTLTIKALVTRGRPEFLDPAFDVGGWSFPSGHSTNAAAMATAIILVFWSRAGRRARIWMVAVGAVYAVGIGATRLALSVHWVSDVIAGLAVGVGWVMLVAALITLTERRPLAPGARAPDAPAVDAAPVTGAPVDGLPAANGTVNGSGHAAEDGAANGAVNGAENGGANGTGNGVAHGPEPPAELADLPRADGVRPTP